MSTVATATNGGRGTTPGKGSGRVLKHIDDILAAPVPVSQQAPLRTLLDKAESLLEQAKSSLTFDRPDYAFEAYIQASIILIKMIPIHRDYPGIKAGQSELKRKHQALAQTVAEQHGAFESVKQRIIKDNRLHSSQPQNLRSKNTRTPQDTSPVTALVNGKKEKPAVHPKPAALHGNAINRGTPTGLSSSKNVDILQARFSKLGGPAASPGQDPRIRTHPPLVPPSVETSSFTQTATLPKMPDAIYSPARGTLTEEAAALPTSTPGLFSRGMNSPSVSKAGQTSRTDYFSGVQNTSTPRKSSFTIPEGNTISPSAVVDLQQKGAKILLIDVRNRDEFDEGHINSQYIICIEPSVLMTENATSDVVRDRMAIGPDVELDLFDRRDTFDAVVIYDQDSSKLPPYMTSRDGNTALLALDRILTNFSIDQRVYPKLLAGGLRAWIDMLGEQCLVPTTVNPLPPSKRRPEPRPVAGRGPIKYTTAGLSSAEINKFKQQAHKEIVRTPSEFIQKFPEIPMEPVSMTQPIAEAEGYYGSPRPPVPLKPPPKPPGHARIQDLPSVLSKPAPTAVKVGTSGLHSAVDSGPSAKLAADGSSAAAQHMTGLINPGTWCFANSTVQALRMSPGFGKELASKDWQASWKIPRRSGEDTDHPQLMARILANLLYWMNNGSFQMMRASTLMEYAGSLTRRDPQVDFSGSTQQDAQEFLTFLMDALSQETNTRRDQYNPSTPPPIMTGGKSVLQGAVEFWNALSKGSSSIIDKYWSFLNVTITTCQNCKNTSYRWEENQILIATVPADSPATTLEECIKEPAERISGFTCDKCGKNRDAVLERKMGRAPELLCVQLGRFQFSYNSNTAQQRKVLTPVTWDLNNINVEPRFLPQHHRIPAPNVALDDHYKGPFNYECYAVITHTGSSISHGHYYTYARVSTGSEPNAWYQLNDSRVSRIKHPAQEIFSAKGSTATPYLAFFRRKHSGSSSVGGHL